jgi:hypothetical protein
MAESVIVVLLMAVKGGDQVEKNEGDDAGG